MSHTHTNKPECTGWWQNKGKTNMKSLSVTRTVSKCCGTNSAGLWTLLERWRTFLQNVPSFGVMMIMVEECAVLHIGPKNSHRCSQVTLDLVIVKAAAFNSHHLHMPQTSCPIDRSIVSLEDHSPQVSPLFCHSSVYTCADTEDTHTHSQTQTHWVVRDYFRMNSDCLGCVISWHRTS